METQLLQFEVGVLQQAGSITAISGLEQYLNDGLHLLSSSVSLLEAYGMFRDHAHDGAVPRWTELDNLIDD